MFEGENDEKSIFSRYCLNKMTRLLLGGKENKRNIYISQGETPRHLIRNTVRNMKSENS